MPAHDLHHHNAIMRFRRCADTIKTLGRNIQCRVIPKCKIGRIQIVIDRFRNSDDRHPVFGKLITRAKRIFPPDCDHSIQFVHLDRLTDLCRVAFFLIRIRAGSSKDGPTPRKDLGNRLLVQLHEIIIDDALPALFESDHVPTFSFRRLHNPADHRVKTWTIPTPCKHSNTFHRPTPLRFV